MKIAIQGGKASFHDITARTFFGDDIETIECDTFELVCSKLRNKEVDYSVLAIENSLAASILLNYELIKKYNLKIIGEHKLRIKLCLMVLPGQTIADINKVMSHYMALIQCENFLDQYPHIEQESFHDTADSAREILNENLLNTGAIASKKAAELYGLDILAEEIETIKENYTRFFVLSRNEETYVKDEDTDKCTLCFQLSDRVGSLAKALHCMEINGINLTKIQSLPILGQPDNYTFYLDCVYSSLGSLNTALVEFEKHTSNLLVLGKYKSKAVILD